MKEAKPSTSRREFVKSGALAAFPLILPAAGIGPSRLAVNQATQQDERELSVNFVYDGPWFSPRAYLEKLREIDIKWPIDPDIYGSGGVTKELEEEFARITGKEKAIYLPSGTMANQVAMKLLNGNHTKVIVPENSHIFRDEADAAQSIHRLRPVPVGQGKPFFGLQELQEAISYLDNNEVFKSGTGTVVIENPVRRADGTVIPLDTIKEVTAFCRKQGYRLHLDGARLHIASAWSKVTVSEYASHFDTVYISLYKYLNAAGGGILCGDAQLIDQVPHQIKILGGNMLQSWPNAAMALHYLKGVEERWEQIRLTAGELIPRLNKVDGTRIRPVENGSNVFILELDRDISFTEFAGHLSKEYNILLRPPDAEGNLRFKVNETLLTREPGEISDAWKAAVEAIRG